MSRECSLDNLSPLLKKQRAKPAIWRKFILRFGEKTLTFRCPNCGAEARVNGDQWDCGFCGDCGRLTYK